LVLGVVLAELVQTEGAGILMEPKRLGEARWVLGATELAFEAMAVTEEAKAAADLGFSMMRCAKDASSPRAIIDSPTQGVRMSWQTCGQELVRSGWCASAAHNPF